MFVKVITCYHGNPIFDAMISQVLTFLIFFLLINDFFKTIANSLRQSQEIDNFSQLTLCVICDVIGIAQHLF